jgi:molybdopterin synthase catalytic subunit/molybdopterin synthase sulfur carrier subunit
MKLTVQLFAVARQWAGAETAELDLSANAKVADVRRALLKQLPKLEQFGSQLRFAVNSAYADEESEILENAEVACIPPVSGG